ncbi:MAG: hypothetical protein ACPGOV_14705 [Magnetovibrionaceae bacterium]
MRHVVQYHRDLALWAVIDSHRDGRVVELVETLTEARNRAFDREEVWYNAQPAAVLKPFQAGERFRPSMIGGA